ncbi:MAG: hypothetical protein JSS58_06835, partial [Proteobacteria bacterium]|nr:hypothetical protein [Pseudomonadota bacterium]
NDFDRAAKLNARDSANQYAKGLTLEKMGCLTAAKRAYQTSAQLGSLLANIQLQKLADPSTIQKKKRSETVLENCAE